MADIVKRFKKNPILTPEQISPSQSDLEVACVLNPGVFTYDNRIWLLIRVAERPVQKPGKISFPILRNDKPEILEFDQDDPKLNLTDPREIFYDGQGYITTLSHFCLASSTDGVQFTIHDDKRLFGQGPYENFGIEDARVAQIGKSYYLTYTAVSDNGYGVGLISTSDWETFKRHGIIISGPNKDCAIFEEKVGSSYWCLHRPSMDICGGNYIWLAESEDLRFWGNHRCIARTRPGRWDGERIGAGAAPVKTDHGWLAIYHGADTSNSDERYHRYCLGALLLDLNDPSRVIARSDEPIMEPLAEYEQSGFSDRVVFANGHIRDGDTVTLYYGAADRVICGAKLSITEILKTL